MIPTRSKPATSRQHLEAALIALLLGACAVAGGLFYCRDLEARYIHAVAPEFTEEKLQGAALQKEAFRQDDLLMLYGSSELVQKIPNNANEFFNDYPTGFRVFPIGKAGTTALAILQKLAAVGADSCGRKLVYSISPGWFFTEKFEPKYYEGNFSDMQALEFVFSRQLSHELKRDVARRMIAYPTTTDDSWLLEFAVDRLAGDSPFDRALFATVWPLGQLQVWVGRAQDHFSAALHIMDEDERLNPTEQERRRVLNWNDILKRAAQFANATVVRTKQNEVAARKRLKTNRAKQFEYGLAHAQEWTDFELLLRTCQELGAEPLFLSMPIEDIRLEVYGLDASARDSYVARLQGLTNRFHYPLLMFRDQEKNPEFLFDFQDHLSAEGWLFYNKALDDFYHGRISSL